MSTYYYGEATYGSGTNDGEFSSGIQPLQDITRIYIGCEPTDGSEANGIFDEFQLFFEEKSDAEILSMFNATQPTTYTTSHQLLAPFDDDLDGGNLFVDGVNVSNWRIYRKKSSDTQYKLISIITNNAELQYSSTMDYEVANNVLYDYSIEGISSTNEVTTKYEIENVSIDFKGIWIVDKNSGNVFQFKYNIPELNTQNESDRIEIKTASKYPRIRRNEYKVKRGQLQADAVYYADKLSVHGQIQLLESLEGSDGLVLKFDNGDIFMADIFNIGYSRHPETDELSTVKCDWVQVGDVV